MLYAFPLSEGFDYPENLDTQPASSRRELKHTGLSCVLGRFRRSRIERLFQSCRSILRSSLVMVAFRRVGHNLVTFVYGENEVKFIRPPVRMNGYIDLTLAGRPSPFGPLPGKFQIHISSSSRSAY
jgi:hypothetical protein